MACSSFFLTEFLKFINLEITTNKLYQQCATSVPRHRERKLSIFRCAVVSSKFTILCSAPSQKAAKCKSCSNQCCIVAFLGTMKPAKSIFSCTRLRVEAESSLRRHRHGSGAYWICNRQYCIYMGPEVSYYWTFPEHMEKQPRGGSSTNLAVVVSSSSLATFCDVVSSWTKSHPSLVGSSLFELLGPQGLNREWFFDCI